MLTSLPLRTARLRLRAAAEAAPAARLSGVFETVVLFLLLADGDEAGGGTYSDGRWTCRPDLVCVAIGVMSDSSELESPALMMPSSSSSTPRLRLLGVRLAPFEAVCRALDALCRLTGVAPAVVPCV